MTNIEAMHLKPGDAVLCNATVCGASNRYIVSGKRYIVTDKFCRFGYEATVFIGVKSDVGIFHGNYAAEFLDLDPFFNNHEFSACDENEFDLLYGDILNNERKR